MQLQGIIPSSSCSDGLTSRHNQALHGGSSPTPSGSGVSLQFNYFLVWPLLATGPLYLRVTLHCVWRLHSWWLSRNEPIRRYRDKERHLAILYTVPTPRIKGPDNNTICVTNLLDAYLSFHYTLFYKSAYLLIRYSWLLRLHFVFLVLRWGSVKLGSDLWVTSNTLVSRVWSWKRFI